MKKKFLIISHFIFLPNEKGNCRYNYLANLLCSANQENEVEIVSSDFSHEQKRHRNLAQIPAALPYKITLLHEPGYPKNVCLKRIGSHKKFSKILKNYLEQRDEPDFVFCAVPSLDVAAVAAKYCKKHKIRFAVDIQDLWPEAFELAFHVPLLSSLLFFPMQKKADFIYRSADDLVAVSDMYLRRGLRANKTCKTSSVVYLGTDKTYFDTCVAKEFRAVQWQDKIAAEVAREVSDKSENTFLVYVGTLGSSYDLNTVFATLRKDKSLAEQCRMVIMGDGPLRKEFEEKSEGLPVVFTGAMPYEQMVWILSRCDIALNPIRKGAAQSIINKHMDYAMAGLPIVNTQQCKEYCALLDRYSCGINCGCENVDDVARAISLLISDVSLRKKMGLCSRAMGEELFDRRQTYQGIVKIFDA